MARKGNPISVRLDLNRSSDSSRFSDYYYGKLVYQDVNLRSYFGSICPPARLTFGFCLGRCIIIHFPKRTFIDFSTRKGKGLVVGIWESHANRVSSFQRQYRRRMKRSVRPHGREKSRVDPTRRH